MIISHFNNAFHTIPIEVQGHNLKKVYTFQNLWHMVNESLKCNEDFVFNETVILISQFAIIRQIFLT